MIEPYRGRRVDPTRDAWVYRNLMRTDGVWYSIMQRGVVVAHATDVCLTNCRFIVREGGRRRVVATGVKNVHAFVVGRVARPKYDPLSVRARYSPVRAPTFEVESDTSCSHCRWQPLHGADWARLNRDGVQIRGARTTP